MASAAASGSRAATPSNIRRWASKAASAAPGARSVIVGWLVSHSTSASWTAVKIGFRVILARRSGRRRRCAQNGPYRRALPHWHRAQASGGRCLRRLRTPPVMRMSSASAPGLRKNSSFPNWMAGLFLSPQTLQYVDWKFWKVPFAKPAQLRPRPMKPDRASGLLGLA